MMDSFVKALNHSERMSCAACVTLFETRQTHALRFSFRTSGFKPAEAQNARSSSACVPYLASMRQQPTSASRTMALKLGKTLAEDFCKCCRGNWKSPAAQLTQHEVGCRHVADVDRAADQSHSE